MLKNYTSSVPAKQSVANIENKLVLCGARKIMKEYDEDNALDAIFFIIPVNGKEIPFKLPAKKEKCQAILRAKVKRPTTQTEKRVVEQAERTAWKIIHDWIEVKMALIELGQEEIVESFLAYVYDASQDKTYYEKLKEKSFRGLLEAPT
jgi:hypothetical protein